MMMNEGDIATVEVEYYDVMYTKHLIQKQKVWEDGFMEHHIKTQKVRI